MEEFDKVRSIENLENWLKDIANVQKTHKTETIESKYSEFEILQGLKLQQAIDFAKEHFVTVIFVVYLLGFLQGGFIGVLVGTREKQQAIGQNQWNR